jgi:hypothetical protein
VAGLRRICGREEGRGVCGRGEGMDALASAQHDTHEKAGEHALSLVAQD